MKNTEYLVTACLPLMTVALLFPRLASAELSYIVADSAYQTSLKQMSASELSREYTKRSGYATYYCGVDGAKRIYQAIRAQEALTFDGSQSSECQSEAQKLQFAVNEVKVRALSTAGDAAESAVKLMRERGLIETPPRFRQFQIHSVQMVPASPFLVTGEAVCAKQASELIDSALKTEMVEGMPMFLRRDKVLTCQFEIHSTKEFGERPSNEVRRFNCDGWTESATIDPQSEEFTIRASSSVAGGLRFVPSLTSKFGAGSGQFEVRGFDAAGNSNAPVLCTAKVTLKLKVSSVQPGLAF